MNLNGIYYEYKKSEGKGYDINLKECIEKTFQHCLDNLEKSDNEKISEPIMMLGKIQSGKTRAYTGLIALAFDNGFDMVFILSKNSKALISQTVSRMKKEFEKFIGSNDVAVSDIMKLKCSKNYEINGYQLEQKNIIVAKKEKNNINRLIKIIQANSIGENMKCLVIDDEADTTRIGYNKIKGEEEYTLRMVASKVNAMRKNLFGYVFVQVTATPYALYLQPEYENNCNIEPIKPLSTILVPHGKDYIGGDYYFIDSRKEDHPASMLFEPIDKKEHEIVSNEKRKGKKSKIEDKRVFKAEEILIKKEQLPKFKKGVINFFVGVIVLRKTEDNKKHFAYVIHTATQKGTHDILQNVVEIFLEQIRNRTNKTMPFVEDLLKASYEDIEKSVVTYNLSMPSYEYVKNEFFNAVDKKYYSIDVVNSDNDVENLLNSESGELDLTTPFSIFVGGQVLDRGVTIPNMIGFYYGRSPKTMQQDTVLQHSRMFGYRKELLPVTRFYTTERIHSNMEKITEIDNSLRKDIEDGKQGNGVYFITRREQADEYGKGYIKPCSPDKIQVSDIRLLESYKRILPVGFSPVCKTEFEKTDKKIEFILSEKPTNKTGEILFDIDDAEKLLELIYSTFKEDEENSRFVSVEEMKTSLRYFANFNKVYCIVFRDRNNAKYRKDGRLHDSPFTAHGSEKEKIEELAKEVPVIALYKEKGKKEGWDGRAFWWPVLVAPKNVPKTIYASKTVHEKINIPIF